MQRKKLIVIGGPTASGKTDFAIQVATHFNTQILSADSRQCYRELNIGVAKPTDQELAMIHHHFINSHSIHDQVSAGVYERFGLQALDTIFQLSDIAVCTGGTGMYLKALCEGIDEMPETDITIMDDIEQQFKINGIEWLQQRMMVEDTAFFQTAENMNPARLMRALCFKLSTGQSILNFRHHQIKERPFDIIKLAIDIDRSELYHRINQRVDRMIEQGLVDEVRELLPFKHLKSLQTVGYSELFEYFDDRATLPECIDKIKQHTRNYAKRQITWFKNQSGYELLSSEKLLKHIQSLG